MARIGLKGLTYATISTGGEGSAVVYTGGVTKGDMMIRADVTLNHEDVKLFADNHTVERANGVVGGQIALELAKLPNDVKEALLGWPSNGNQLTVTEDPAPYVGFGYIVGEIAGGVKSYIGYWFPKCQFGLDSDSASTKGENTEFQTNSLTGEILGVVTTTGGKAEFYYTDTESGEAEVVTWLKAKAGIS